MTAINRVLIGGNLTRDPQRKELGANSVVADLSLAINETTRGRDGETRETVCYVDVVVWNKQADTCAEYLRKGSPVLVEGRLLFESWEDKEGHRHNRLKVRGERVHFLGKGAGGGGGSGREAVDHRESDEESLAMAGGTGAAKGRGRR